MTLHEIADLLDPLLTQTRAFLGTDARSRRGLNSSFLSLSSPHDPNSMPLPHLHVSSRDMPGRNSAHEKMVWARFEATMGGAFMHFFEEIMACSPPLDNSPSRALYLQIYPGSRRKNGRISSYRMRLTLNHVDLSGGPVTLATTKRRLTQRLELLSRLPRTVPGEPRRRFSIEDRSYIAKDPETALAIHLALSDPDRLTLPSPSVLDIPNIIEHFDGYDLLAQSRDCLAA